LLNKKYLFVGGEQVLEVERFGCLIAGIRSVKLDLPRLAAADVWREQQHEELDESAESVASRKAELPGKGKNQDVEKG
jgi:hypothetical protein